MKDGRGLVIAAVIGLGLWAWQTGKLPKPTHALSLLPAEKQPKPVQTTIETYTGATGEIAPLVKTASDFSATYGMSEKAAIDTALRYAANPSSSEFADLTTRDKQNLANIVVEAQAAEPILAPSAAEAQVTALIGSQPTASVQELDIVEQTYGRESEAYQATIDTAFEAAQAEATGGVVSWSSEVGYQAISQEAAASPEYWVYF